jgi:hypothetical protein
MHICVRILTNVLNAHVWRDSKTTLCMYNIQFLRTHSTLKFRTLALNISKLCSCYRVLREELSKWILTNYFSHWISNHFFNISFHCQVMLPKSAFSVVWSVYTHDKHHFGQGSANCTMGFIHIFLWGLLLDFCITLFWFYRNYTENKSIIMNSLMATNFVVTIIISTQYLLIYRPKNM